MTKNQNFKHPIRAIISLLLLRICLVEDRCLDRQHIITLALFLGTERLGTRLIKLTIYVPTLFAE